MRLTSVEEALFLLKRLGPQIGARARGGDATAQEVVTAYTLLHRCPDDPAAQVVLLARLEEYLEEGP